MIVSHTLTISLFVYFREEYKRSKVKLSGVEISAELSGQARSGYTWIVSVLEPWYLIIYELNRQHLLDMCYNKVIVHLVLPPTLWDLDYYFSILQITKLRHREVRSLFKVMLIQPEVQELSFKPRQHRAPVLFSFWVGAHHTWDLAL